MKARSTTSRSNSATAISLRPLPAAWAYGWSIPATPSSPATPMHSSWLHNCSRLPWSSTWPKTTFPRLRSQILHRTGLPVDAFDRSQMNKIATGRLLTIDNQVDTTTGTIRFRAQFDNQDLALYPNQFVNARLLVSTLHNTLLIPSAAVQRNGVQAFVYKVSNNTHRPFRTLWSRPPMATSLRSKGSTQATPSRSPALTNCRMAPRLRSRNLRKNRSPAMAKPQAR